MQTFLVETIFKNFKATRQPLKSVWKVQCQPKHSVVTDVELKIPAWQSFKNQALRRDGLQAQFLRVQAQTSSRHWPVRRNAVGGTSQGLEQEEDEPSPWSPPCWGCTDRARARHALVSSSEPKVWVPICQGFPCGWRNCSCPVWKPREI